jgi:hypothetical protein
MRIQITGCFFKPGTNMYRLIRKDMRAWHDLTLDANMAEGAWACVNYGRYEFRRLTMEEIREWHGQMLSDSRYAEDASDVIQVKVHLGASTIGNGNNAYETLTFELASTAQLRCGPFPKFT